MPELITPGYRELNSELHVRKAEYGAGAGKRARTVMKLVWNNRIRSVLDYGAGKCTLHQECQHWAAEARIRWGLEWQNYDPAIAGLDAPARPADFIFCCDVLEHVEPECLDAVLDDIKRCHRGMGLFIIATAPARDTLADGRNAHLTIERGRFWFNKFADLGLETWRYGEKDRVVRIYTGKRPHR